ncbi:B12-binding domain-containing radical SAM protein [Candidatus Latescibacterota bacterium]
MKPVRVALISSPLTEEERYGAFSGAGSSQPTFALVCLGAVAQQENADVFLLDASAKGLTVEETVEEVAAFSPDIVGISSTTAGIVASGDLARLIKKACPTVTTLIGGPHVTAIPNETLEEFGGFDIAVIGEGELTFGEILASQRDNGAINDTIPGTVVRRDGVIVMNVPRAPIESLDNLPLPAWGLLSGFPEAYRPSPMKIHRFPCATVVLARGCPNRCTFCDRSVFGNRIRSYSPDYVIAMIRDLQENYGVREILIEDDTFVISKQRVGELCQRLIDENIDISWSCLGRADRVKPDLLKLMKRAGCWHISYGVESGDPDILASVGKGERISHIVDAVKWSHDAGIRTKGFFMVGFPGETQESIRLTQKLALDLALDDISVMQLTPFPGSDIYRTAESQGTFDRDWRKMNILTTVFVPHCFTKESLEAARSSILKAFYFRPRIIMTKLVDIIKRPRLIPYMARSFVTLVNVIRSVGKDRSSE